MKSRKPIHCAAVDLGATSGRVIVGTWHKHTLELTEVHRFPNQFRSLGPNDYWDLPGLWHEIQVGLHQARRAFPKLVSVGIDTWGVDYVLLDKNGRLIFPAHAYRDARTQPGLNDLATHPRTLERIYQATGIPNAFYNTSLQLAETVAHYPDIKKIVRHCSFLPDYFGYLLTGKLVNELSIASTTQLLSAQRPTWSATALRHFGVPARWFTKPVQSNTVLGPITQLPDWQDVRVISVPGHDTAAAYAAMPAHTDGKDLYISSGTWSLVGFESDHPLLSVDALHARISNERTGEGRFRPLTNVIGLWLLEQTLLEFTARPQSAEQWSTLIAAARACPAPRELLNVNDPAFVNPSSMRAVIDQQLRARKLPRPTDLPQYVRLICDSLGAGHAAALRNFEKLSGQSFRRILMVGGGAKNALLCQATADAAGLPLHAYSIEGSAMGNIASQLIALREVENLTTFRAHLSQQLQATVYSPRS